MTTTTKTQTRGICQCCGHDQAVLGTGRMSKHGYTVKDGWFNGVCSGQKHRPLQIDRTVTDHTIADVRAQCKALRERAARLESGEIDPTTVRGHYSITLRDYPTIPFAHGTEYQQDEARKSAVFTARRRAEIGEGFADSLTRMAADYHGQPLREVAVDAGPAPIQLGEQRQGAQRLLTCSEVRAGRVYWKDSNGKRGWTGTQAWRRLPAAA
jgi:hypothetical protein